MIYYGTWTANGDLRPYGAYRDTNLKRLIGTVRDISNANRFNGRISEWIVWDEKNYLTAGGYTNAHGVKKRYHSDILEFYAPIYGFRFDKSKVINV